MPVSAFLFAALVFVLAGMVKGITGMGLPTVAIALLPILLPIGLAASLLVMPSLLTNIWQFVRSPRCTALIKRLAGLLAGVVFGAVLSPLPNVSSASTQTLVLLGLALTFYGVVALVGWRLPHPGRHEWWAGPLAGVATGALTVASGVFVVPSVPYLQSLGLDKAELVGALGLTFTVCTVVLWFSLGVSPTLSANALWSLLMLGPALLGMWIGAALRGRLSDLMFKRCFLGTLIMLGVYTVMRAIGST
ncbi:sulfite exporter TauE/SafE family protein [Hydrogenophaga borbori]|uniref:sulfite exporter TauE/SafE family protein n=1 Tax=Hydrogenophaga borbori TaxID=2294117 RepID=UPI00301B9833